MSNQFEQAGGNVVVIGVGNPYRSDDGVGPAITRHLRKISPEGVQIVERDGEATSLMETWHADDRVIIVDAVSADSAPGTIHRFNANEAPLARTLFQYSSHAFGVNEAIELSRALNKLPNQLIVYGIAGENFAAGIELSPQVALAAERAATRIAGELAR